MKTQKVDGRIIVTTEKGAYQVSEEVWSQLEPLIVAGQDADTLLALVSSVKASDVKAYDKERAEKAKLRAEQQDAVDTLTKTLKGYKWSPTAKSKAKALFDASVTLSELQIAPIVIDFADLQEVDHLVNASGQWSFRLAVRGGEKLPLIEVSPNVTLPLIAARQAFEVARFDFQTTCANEVAKLVPEILKTSLRVSSFSVDDTGNIVFGYSVKVPRGTGGGGKRKGITYEYKGMKYTSLTELGRTISPNAKYPHKSAAALVEKGEVIVIQEQEQEQE